MRCVYLRFPLLGSVSPTGSSILLSGNEYNHSRIAVRFTNAVVSRLFRISLEL